MANKIQIRRGLKTNLPALDVGEPALCTDTKEVFVGNAGGNVALVNKEIMDEHLKNYTLQVPYAQAAGSANAYTAILNPSLVFIKFFMCSNNFLCNSSSIPLPVI